MAASMAVSKLLNLRNPALQSLIRRQLLNPAAASPALPDARSLDLFHQEKRSTAESPNHCSSNSRKSNLDASNLPLNLQWPVCFSAIQIEAARTYVPKYDDDYQDVDDDEDEDEDEDEDDVDDDVDIQDYSGSDFDDENGDGKDYDVVAENPRRSSS